MVLPIGPTMTVGPDGIPRLGPGVTATERSPDRRARAALPAYWIAWPAVGGRTPSPEPRLTFDSEHS